MTELTEYIFTEISRLESRKMGFNFKVANIGK